MNFWNFFTETKRRVWAYLLVAVTFGYCVYICFLLYQSKLMICKLAYHFRIISTCHL